MEAQIGQRLAALLDGDVEAFVLEGPLGVAGLGPALNRVASTMTSMLPSDWVMVLARAKPNSRCWV